MLDRQHYLSPYGLVQLRFCQSASYMLLFRILHHKVAWTFQESQKIKKKIVLYCNCICIRVRE